MAKDGLFFARAGVLNRAHVPGWSLLAQGIWSAALVLPRTYNPDTQTLMAACIATYSIM